MNVKFNCLIVIFFVLFISACGNEKNEGGQHIKKDKQELKEEKADSVMTIVRESPQEDCFIKVDSLSFDALVGNADRDSMLHAYIFGKGSWKKESIEGQWRESMGYIPLVLYNIRIVNPLIKEALAVGLRQLDTAPAAKHKVLRISGEHIEMKYLYGDPPLYCEEGEFYLGYTYIAGERWLVRSRDLEAYLFFDTKNVTNPTVINFIDGGVPNESSLGFEVDMRAGNDCFPVLAESYVYRMAMFKIEIDEGYATLARRYIDQSDGRLVAKNIRMVITREGVRFFQEQDKCLRFSYGYFDEPYINWGYLSFPECNIVVCTTEPGFRPFKIKNAESPRLFEYYQYLFEYVPENTKEETDYWQKEDE